MPEIYGPTGKIPFLETDTLKVEIFRLATVDISCRFLYRVIAPFEMIWQTDGIVSGATQLTTAKNDFIAHFLMDKWQRIIQNSKHLDEWHESLSWMENLKYVEYYECSMTPNVYKAFKVVTNRMDK